MSARLKNLSDADNMTQRRGLLANGNPVGIMRKLSGHQMLTMVATGTGGEPWKNPAVHVRGRQLVIEENTVRMEMEIRNV